MDAAGPGVGSGFVAAPLWTVAMNRYPRRDCVSMNLGLLGVVTEHVTNIEDMGLQHVGLNERIGPERLQKLVVGDEPPRPPHQVIQHEEGLRREQ